MDLGILTELKSKQKLMQSKFNEKIAFYITELSALIQHTIMFRIEQMIGEIEE